MSDPPDEFEATESTNEQLARIREHIHPHCVVCGSQNLAGLHLDFSALPDGSVQSEFCCRRVFEGYPHTLHGGIICLLLDGAMTNCLFVHDRIGVTAELCVKFQRPVATERPVLVRAQIVDSSHHLHYLSAELQQDGRTMAIATAKFMEQPKSADR
jgi:acyl-coenzyme A thioesterase PaaI-like protein